MINIIDKTRLFDEEAAKEQRNRIVGAVLDSIKQVKVLDKGYGLRFGSADEDYLLLTDWVFVERICNPFLRFGFKFESNRGPVWLDVAGPEGTKQFLKNEFALGRWL